MNGELSDQLRGLRRAVSRRRHVLAAGLAAAAVACALTAVQPAAADTVTVLVAAHDLPPGATVTADDVRSAAFAPSTVPDGALRAGPQAVGHVLAGAVRAGEPLTDVRFVGRSLLSALAGDGLVAAPVRIADAGSVRLLQAGDVVDVLAATAPGSGVPGAGVPGAGVPGAGVPGAGSAAPAATEAGLVAEAVHVLAVPADDDAAGEGALVLLAATRPTAARLALASVTARLSITLRGG